MSHKLSRWIKFVVGGVNNWVSGGLEGFYEGFEDVLGGVGGSA